MGNLNTKEYWETRFLSNWKGAGETQTIHYAKANVACINTAVDFNGSILDFGCALGDAIPVYSAAFPKARLEGIDISENAIAICKAKYGALGNFRVGTAKDISFSNIIIASHVLEHLSDDKMIVEELVRKCNDLYVFVPFRESPLFVEHVNYYDMDYYDNLNVVEKKVFIVEYKRKLPFMYFIKNLYHFRLVLNNDFRKNVIMFHFKGTTQ
jgi:SAM-dependent methyltransferase